MVVEKSSEQLRINGSVKLSAQEVSFSLESNVSCDYVEIVPRLTTRDSSVFRSIKNSPSHARKMSIRPLKMFPIFTIANIRIFRFRSRHFAISNNFQYDRKSFSQGGKKKRWYYLNGGYPNVCRDRESQDRESENTVARHH